MSLETLLEAARYIELQEIKQKQASPPNTTAKAATPLQIRSNVTSKPLQQQQQPPLQQQQGDVTASTQNNANPAVTTTTTPPIINNNGTTNTTTTTTAFLSNRLKNVQAAQRMINNSFDIINPLIIDEAGEARRKQPPLVFRSGTREVHNKLEKHRRAHLKECFDMLKKQLPAADEKKTSNLNILHSAIKCIQTLKKEERELEHLMERLAREKIAFQQKLAVLKKDVSSLCDCVDAVAIMPDVIGGVDAQVHNIEHEELIIKEEEVIVDDLNHVHHHPQLIVEENGDTVGGNLLAITTQQHPPSKDVQVSIGNVLKLGKATIPVVAANAVPTATQAINGTSNNKDNVVPQTTQVQTAALSVLPIGYQMNQGLVLQKVIMPKNIGDFTQLVSSPPVAHFIATTPQQLEGKVVPIVNAQYVVKPLVVVSTPSRPS